MKILNENFKLEKDVMENGEFYVYTGEETSYSYLEFASFPNAEKVLCSYRNHMWFGAGKCVSKMGDVPYETQFICILNKDKTYSVLYALCEEPMRFSFYGIEGDRLGICADTGDTTTKSTGKVCVYTATGTDVYELLDSAPESIAEQLKTCRVREEKKMPEFAEYFGWCTWDSFYEKVTADDVKKGLESFKKGGFVPRFLLLDDGWQTVNDTLESRGEHKLSSFSPNEKFNHDLSEITSIAKDEYGVKYFYVWHALMGYWGGTDPESKEMAKYKPKLKKLTFSESSKKVHPDVPEFMCGVVSSDKLFDYYCDYHRLLSNSGVDGVKVDVQFNAEAAGEEDGGRVRMARKYREALEASVNLNFGGGLINCMPGSNDLTYHTKASNVTRTSDDFYPLDDASHGRHIYNNAVNSLWIGGFSVCDWDMFQTKHKFGEFHAVSRAVSGSPIYVSDKVDEHDFGIIKKLTTSDGKLLMAEKTARPCLDSLFISDDFYDVYKIFNYNKYGGVIACFNLTDKKEVFTKSVKPSDIDEFCEGRYAVYSYKNGICHALEAAEEVSVSLAGLEFDVFTVAPIICGKAVIGLSDKYNSGGAVLMAENRGDDLYVIFTGGGEGSVYSENKPKRIMADGKEIAFSYNDNLIKFDFESADETEIYILY